MIGIHLVILLIFSIVLIKAADIVIISLKSISRKTHTGVFTLSAIILALGTSLPELFVGITSGLEEAPNLSLGNVLGANIANLCLVGGIPALVVGRVQVTGVVLRHEAALGLVAGIAPLLLLLDGELERTDGLILLSIYGVYVLGLFRRQFQEVARGQTEDKGLKKLLRQLPMPDSRRSRDYAKLSIGIAFLLLSGKMIVDSATALAAEMNIPIFLVGLVILSIGTTLPEIAFSFRALRDHESSMFFGNLLGSIITNSTLVLGVVALLSPIRVVAMEDYLTAIIAFIVIFALFWFFIRSKHRLERWEALMLVTIYIIFVIIEFM